MSKVISTNYVDTPISGVTSLNFARGLVNYKADWRVKNQAADEAKLINITSPVPYPETMRISVSDVADVYKNSGVEIAAQGPTKRGKSILVQLNENWTVTDSTDPTFSNTLPVQAHMVIKVPNSDVITPDMVLALVGRVVSGLYETGSVSPTRLAAMLRGSLLPSDL